MTRRGGRKPAAPLRLAALEHELRQAREPADPRETTVGSYVAANPGCTVREVITGTGLTRRTVETAVRLLIRSGVITGDTAARSFITMRLYPR